MAIQFAQSQNKIPQPPEQLRDSSEALQRLLQHQLAHGDLVTDSQLHKVHALGDIQGDLLGKLSSSLPKITCKDIFAMQVCDRDRDRCRADECGFEPELAL